MSRRRTGLVWAGLVSAIVLPIVIAATSPFLEYRSWIYIGAGFAGIVGLTLILLQPLLASGALPGVSTQIGRRVHRWIGSALVVAVLLHVGGLYLTSPPDVIDALLFASPTPFSLWGVLAMWALFAAAFLGLARKSLRIQPRLWRFLHTVFALAVVAGTVAHTLLIQGAMGTVSKTVLCGLVLVVTIRTLFDLRSWVLLRRLIPDGAGRG